MLLHSILKRCHMQQKLSPDTTVQATRSQSWTLQVQQKAAKPLPRPYRWSWGSFGASATCKFQEVLSVDAQKQAFERVECGEPGAQ